MIAISIHMLGGASDMIFLLVLNGTVALNCRRNLINPSTPTDLNGMIQIKVWIIPF